MEDIKEFYSWDYLIDLQFWKIAVVGMWLVDCRRLEDHLEARLVFVLGRQHKSCSETKLSLPEIYLAQVHCGN